MLDTNEKYSNYFTFVNNPDIECSGEIYYDRKTNSSELSYINEYNEYYKGKGLSNSDYAKSFWHTHRGKCIVSTLRRFYASGTFFVDVGGGAGYIAELLMKEGFDAAVFEPTQVVAQKAKERGIPLVFCGMFDSNNVKPNSIPLIGLFDVIEHINDEKAFFESISPLLTLNGKVCITVPAYNSLWSSKDDVAKHFRRYSLKQLDKVLRNSGFKIIYKTYFFSLLLIPMYFLKALPYKFSKLFFKLRRVKESELLSNNDNPYKNEHKLGKFDKISSFLLGFELRCISKSKRIPFGASILVLAEKEY